MRFLALLQSGASTEGVAKIFARRLKERSEAASELCAETAANFVNECFTAIGINPNILPSDMHTDKEYVWSEEWRIFSFTYNPFMFTPFERFLVHFCEAIDEQQSVHVHMIENLECPVEWLMELVADWCSFYRQLQEKEKLENTQRFNEPLARINFQLLYGIHSIRKKYSEQYHLLNNICDRLYRSALDGLRYEQTHIPVITGLLDIFEDDYYLFYQHAHDTINLYYYIFTVQCSKQMYLLALKRLETMLESHAATPTRLLVLTNFLIQPSMQQVYYTLLKLEKQKYMLSEVLTFLKLLQSKLSTVDSFSQDFIEIILMQVIHEDTNISLLAAELYVLLMQRKFNNDLILKHILEFYIQTMDSLKYLKHYISSLWSHFPYMHHIDIYLDIIGNPSTNQLMRCFTSNVMLVIYSYMLKHADEYQQKIDHVLETLVPTLTKVKCQLSTGILLEIYAVTNFELVRNFSTNFEKILSTFEIYASQAFTDARQKQYPLLYNLFEQLHICAQYTSNTLILEECTKCVVEQYEQLEVMLQEADNNKKLPSQKLCNQYRTVLQKLSIIYMLGFNFEELNKTLFGTLKARFIDSTTLQEHLSTKNILAEVYAVELIVNCFKLVDQECSLERNQILAAQAQELLHYLYESLQKRISEKKKSILHIKTLFYGLLSLYSTFTSSSEICHLKVESQKYHLLVQTLIHINFEKCTFDTNLGDEDMQAHPMRILEYQRIMLQQFTSLHAIYNIDISSNLSWKVCMFYGWHTHTFNDQLGTLLQVLANHHLHIYKNIIGVIIYNLYKHRPRLHDAKILASIKAHRTLIDNQLQLQSPQVLKVHIVLVVLDILKKSLHVLKINLNSNRLEPIKHLHVLLENLNVNSRNVLSDILQQANALKKFLLTDNERKTLEAFLKQFTKKQ